MNVEYKVDSFGKQYKVVNGTYYDVNMSDVLLQILEDARLNKKRVRLFYGDTTNGVVYPDIKAYMGYLARSGGSVKIPLLVPSKTAKGGDVIRVLNILKVTCNRQVVYTHPFYKDPIYKVTPEGTKHVVRCGYTGAVLFKAGSLEKANSYVEYLTGLKNKA